MLEYWRGAARLPALNTAKRTVESSEAPPSAPAFDRYHCEVIEQPGIGTSLLLVSPICAWSRPLRSRAGALALTKALNA